MRQFYLTYENNSKLQPLVGEISWTKHLIIMSICKDDLEPHPPINSALPKIGITMGDPTGIGPEIIVKALSMKEPFQACRPIVFGDRDVLSRAIQMQNLSATLEVIEKIPEAWISP